MFETLIIWSVGLVLVGIVSSAGAVFLKRKLVPKVINTTLDFLIGS